MVLRATRIGSTSDNPSQHARHRANDLVHVDELALAVALGHAHLRARAPAARSDGRRIDRVCRLWLQRGASEPVISRHVQRHFGLPLRTTREGERAGTLSEATQRTFRPLHPREPDSRTPRLARWPRQVFGLMGERRWGASVYWMPLPRSRQDPVRMASFVPNYRCGTAPE